MKIKIVVSIAMVALCISVYGKYLWVGGGVSGTATTTATVVSVPGTNYAYCASIKNLGAQTIYFSKAGATNGWVATNAIAVPTNSAYTCIGGFYHNEDKSRAITNLVIATTNGTSDYTIAFE